MKLKAPEAIASITNPRNASSDTSRAGATGIRVAAVTLGATDLAIGCGANDAHTTDYSDIDIGEIIIRTEVDSTTNRQLIEGYLAWKWGLQSLLPSDHPYKNGWPSVGGSRRKFGSSLFRSTLFNAGLAR